MTSTTSERTELAKWETWPIWALGLSNGLNVFIWFALSMIGLNAPELDLRLPLFVNGIIPFVILVGAAAASASLDGVIVATLAGVRQGRNGMWSWLTILAAGGFAGLIAYAVHSGAYREWAWLHVAQIAVMIPYNLHLSQSKRVDTEGAKSAGDVRKGLNAPKEGDVLETGYTCRRCGLGGFEALPDVQRHQKAGCLPRAVTGSTQRIGGGSTDGVSDIAEG